MDILEERSYDVTPLFISIDPKRDTPEVVADFTDNLHPRMVGLTGSERLRGLSAGGGYAYRLYNLTIRADYAYRDLGIIGGNHTYSLSFGF